MVLSCLAEGKKNSEVKFLEADVPSELSEKFSLLMISCYMVMSRQCGILSYFVGRSENSNEKFMQV